MIDAEPMVYTRVATRFKEAYPNGISYNEHNDSPAKFPCLTCEKIDSYTYDGSLDSEMREHHSWETYRINAYSNKVSTAKTECKAIMDLASDEMISMGFTRIYCVPTKNVDTKIYRMTAEFRAVISEDYRVYRK